MRTLSSAEEISFNHVILQDNTNWRCIGSNRKRLRFIHCNIVDENFQSILEKNQLEVLRVSDCFGLTKNSLVNIGKHHTLRRLGLKLPDSSGNLSQDIDIGCISALDKLTHLYLSFFNAQYEHTGQLWKSFKQLKVLDLR